MELRQIMTNGVLTVAEDALAEAAWHRMNLEQVHHLVVVRGKDVVGLISERDLGGPHGDRVCAGREVKDLMIRDIITASPDTTVQEAATMLRGYSIGCLPVLEGDQLVGIVTVSDLLSLVAGDVPYLEPVKD